MKVRSLSSWLLLAATASTAAFAPARILSSSVKPNTTSTGTNGGNSSSITTTCANPATATTTAMSASTATATDDATDVETKKPVEIFRKDYEALRLIVSKINMDIDIRDNRTVITSELFLSKNPSLGDDDDDCLDVDLVLDGDETSIELLGVKLNGKDLIEGDNDNGYVLEPGRMIVKNPPPGSVLTTTVAVVPEKNTQLSGLYKSGPMYCTQCEAMGFRRITYYPDRPDNMAVFDRVRLEADKEEYPVLLANGNLMEEGDVEEDEEEKTTATTGRHYAVWRDPYPKPSYLFCCVAGKLGMISDSYTTVPSGRKVDLRIYSDPKDAHKLTYAMESLKNSMKWDEDVYGLEYDLDLYNIVAVDSFNMGAMENKGLNVFNTAYVLADPNTATDTDYERVEGVIGHEYFHNWTGNRVTCRDWFQLTLKEGLTVFRDQEFSGDMNSKAVKRIESVASLRASQFAQDAGPMSHPIRPDSYISMDNFYTATVYNKGAEVIRMYHTLLGPEGFRKGMDLYFERHDGSAVTCDDFRSAMADATGTDLDQFASWYSTKGTPVVTYEHEYDETEKRFTLRLSQTSESETPLHIPISIGLLDRATREEVLPTTVLNFRETDQEFVFDDVRGPVVPSLLRQFSAPIKLVPVGGEEDQEEALAFLAASDTDGFNRWEAGQTLMTNLIFELMSAAASSADDGGDANAAEAVLGSSPTWNHVKEAFERTILDSDSPDRSILAYALTLPSEGALTELVPSGTHVDPIAIRTARGSLKVALAREFRTALSDRYDSLTKEQTVDSDDDSSSYKVDAASIGARKLRNVCLDYLCSIKGTASEEESAAALAESHYDAAKGMTDRVAALAALVSNGKRSEKAASVRDAAVARFYDEANGDALVLDKWFAIQAQADLPDALERIKALRDHPEFSLVNPNRCRSLVGGFVSNASGFHASDGSGYAFVREVLTELDALNPQISGRLASSLIAWRKLDPNRSSKMRSELETLSKLDPISDDLFEIVTRGLKD
eukprot:CAMPEP_0197181820 /NCGR_PEP_ID=MMETSP1423-20130617/5987_1 /TAXON_ID=476441 /ORGANISM="Pseudo-nitzschia heimii, Strain UNC1101" /LENGTH=1006 /DNA_ID=CAMNT_0042632139 /DNA_START=229 /DNA_END=3249 /DNA_ORIENTATION=-